ncbi:MAG: hypothetical protein JXB33_01685 [Clostridia bacterium]|nr:hypothetical protein [Clostridia bacterium]
MKKGIYLAISILLAGLMLSGCVDVSVDPFTGFEYVKEEKPVVTSPVERRDFEIYKTVYGSSIPKARETYYYKDVTGYFKEYKVGLLDTVKEGDVVAVLDSGVLDKQIRDQKIQYEKARLIYEKARIQYESTGQGEFAMASAQLDFESEEYKYNKLLEQLSALELRAGMDGFVSKRYANPGDLMNAAAPVIDITDESEIFISFDGKDTPGIGIGEILDIQIRNSTEIIKGEVVSIMDSEIIIKPETVHESFERTGTLVYVRILKDKRLGTLVVKSNAIISEAGRTYVYVYENGIKNERDIKTGIEDDGYTEVIFGLEEGELVIENPYR